MPVIIGNASQFAITQHRAHNQMYGRKPYEYHLIEVVSAFIRFRDWDEIHQDFIDAAWLHDTIEDTGTTRESLKEAGFTNRAVDLVWAVTDGTGENRAARKASMYPKVRDTPGAIEIKLADRIANVSNSVSYLRVGKRPAKIFKMYSKEHGKFQDELRGRSRGEGAAAQLMWDELDYLFRFGQMALDSDNKVATL